VVNDRRTGEKSPDPATRATLAQDHGVEEGWRVVAIGARVDLARAEQVLATLDRPPR
jgi:hypothetical protein